MSAVDTFPSGMKQLKAKALADGIEVWCSHEKLVPVEDLKPNPRNPNTHPDHQIELLSRNIKYFGWRRCISVSSRSGFIVAGHGRLMAAKKLGVKIVPVEYQDFASEDEELAVLIADNRLAELSETDDDGLKNLIKELDGKIDLDLTGFDADSLDDIWGRVADNEPEAAIPNLPKIPISKAGDLYELGNHRLLCGDSTKEEDVLRLMNGQKAVLFATDPPYLVGYDGCNHPQGNKDWSETYGATWDDADKNSDLYKKFLACAVKCAINPDAPVYIWHASRRQKMLEEEMEAAGMLVHCQIVWVKNRPVMTRTWYLWQHEPCLMGWIKGNRPKRISKDYESTVWTMDTLAGDERPEHPTPKPLECFQIPMKQHTREGDICYEPFCGSGTQIVAAEKIGRRCFGMEVSPQYCDVIVKRWLNLGDGRTVKRNGEDITDQFLEKT